MPRNIVTKSPRKCSIDECQGKYLSRGFCHKHYRAAFKPKGDPLRSEFSFSAAREYLENKTERIPFSTCWYWTGYVANDGYGVKSMRDHPVKVHRLSYVVYNGPIDDGLVVRHSCHERTCINPNHLSIGTPRDNAQDMVEADRQASGKKHGMAKLTESQVLEIRALAGRFTHREIGERFNVTRPMIGYIINRKNWKHI